MGENIDIAGLANLREQRNSSAAARLLLRQGGCETPTTSPAAGVPRPHLVHAFGLAGEDHALVAQRLVETGSPNALQRLLGAGAGSRSKGWE